MNEKELIERRKQLVSVDELPDGIAAEPIAHIENAPEEVKKFYPNIID